MMLQLFYGSLAVFAAWATWRNDDIRPIGLAMLFSFAASNAIWYYGTPAQRPGVFTMCEVIITLTALTAWYAHHNRGYIAIAVTASLSVCCNIAFATISDVKLSHINFYEITTNILFAIECLLVFTIGIIDRVHFNSRSVRNSDHTALNVASKVKAQDK